MQDRRIRYFAIAGLIAATSGIAVGAAENSPPADTATGDATDVTVQVFKGVSAKKLDAGSYPESERRESNEGWVRLNFMVDPEGTPYEISVEGSLGGKPFERNAIEALKKSTFVPATLNGHPVHSATSLKYKFSIQDLEKGASGDFVSKYRNFTSKVQGGDRLAADALLPGLKATNLYEDAYRNVALYQYNRVWGTESEQIENLQDAIAGESTDKYLEKKVLVQLTGALLMLNLKRAYFAESWFGWLMLQRLATAKELEPWKPVMAKVQSVLESDSTLKLHGEITRGDSWFHPLLRPKFSVVLLSGGLADIKIRCEKGYLFFRFEPGLQYTVNRRDGQCGLELVGDPNTRFELIESS